MPMKKLFFIVAIQLLSITSQAAERSQSPDGSTTYKCGAEKQSAEGCFNYWVKSYSPDLPKSAGTSDGKWLAAYCKYYNYDNYKSYLCFQGGVAWWYWTSGAIGSQELKGFTHRDYSVPGNDNLLGTAKQIKGSKGCYSVRGRTFCMVPMVNR
jgi:hypothetical protein